MHRFFRKERFWPIGLHVSSRTATIVQLAGQESDLRIAAMTRVALPEPPETAGKTGASAGEPDPVYDRAVADVLRRAVSDKRFVGRQVISCLSSQNLRMQNVRVPRVSPEETAQIVAAEAEDRLGYAAAEAEIRHLPVEDVRHDAEVKQEVIMLACPRTVIGRHIGILEAAHLTPVAIDPEPCAVLRSLRLPADDVQRRAYLNIGDDAITVTFGEGDRILFLKQIGSGGALFDRAVARFMDLPPVEAARLRSLVREAGVLDEQDEIHRAVIQAMREPLEAMAGEIQLCLRYYKVTFRAKPLESILVTGSESTYWLQEFLQDRLETNCELVNPLTGLVRPDLKVPAQTGPGSWGTAIGLSLKGVEQARVKAAG